MSLNPVLPSSGSQQASPVAKPGGGDGAPVGAGGRGFADTVRLSDQGRMLSRLSDRMPPTPDVLRKRSAALAGDLKMLFRQNAVETRRDIGFSVDLAAGKISVQGGPADAPAIGELISSHPDIERQMLDLAALSRHVFAAEQGADARLAKRMAHSAAQIGAVVADYSSRFGDKNEMQEFSPIPAARATGTPGVSSAIAHYTAISATAAEAVNFSLVFNGAGLQVHANGKPWISSGT